MTSINTYSILMYLYKLTKIIYNIFHVFDRVVKKRFLINKIELGDANIKIKIKSNTSYQDKNIGIYDVNRILIKKID